MIAQAGSRRAVTNGTGLDPNRRIVATHGSPNSCPAEVRRRESVPTRFKSVKVND